MESSDQIIKQLLTIRDYMRWAVSRFTQTGIYYGHGTDNAWDEALQLVLHGLHLPPDIGPTILDAKLTMEERKLLLVLFNTRMTERLPVPYITGTAWFCGLEFKVDERVIIPRSPIGELIEQGYQPWLGEKTAVRVLDLCCGSGCIGIATAHMLPESEVDVVDLSDDALTVAQMNIEAHEMLEQVFPIKSDLFEAIPEGTKYDLIVSNPPYVDQEDLDSMPGEYHHEPRMALEAGDDGLELAHRIIAQAADYLSDDGYLIVEVGNSCIALDRAYPELQLEWIEFARGGLGVFIISREALLAYQAR